MRVRSIVIHQRHTEVPNAHQRKRQIRQEHSPQAIGVWEVAPNQREQEFARLYSLITVHHLQQVIRWTKFATKQISKKLAMKVWIHTKLSAMANYLALHRTISCLNACIQNAHKKTETVFPPNLTSTRCAVQLAYIPKVRIKGFRYAEKYFSKQFRSRVGSVAKNGSVPLQMHAMQQKYYISCVCA